MTRLAALVVLATACTGTYYPYPSQPTYATAQTQQVSQSQDGATTTTTTQTYSYQSNDSAPVAQPAVYEAPPADDPPPPSLCDPQDTANMCVAVTVIVDIGDILTDVHDGSCRDASRALNRYADSHAREIDTLIRLRELESPARLAGWEDRHRARAEGVMAAALDLDTRCEHNAKLDRAFRRVGFTGLIGSPAL
jgi:hypothetical protein